MQQNTSLAAYASIVYNLGSKQWAVFNALKTKSMTNQEIADYLNWPINCVTGRCKELRERGVVVEEGKKEVNGRKAIVWGVKKSTLF